VIIFWLNHSRVVCLSLVFVFVICENGLECLELLFEASRSNIDKPSFDGWKTITSSTPQLRCLKVVHSISDYGMFVLYYDCFAYTFVGNVLLVGIALNTTIAVTAGFATIRMYPVIPMPYYVVFPIFLVTFALSIFLWFPYGVKANELFKQIKRNWRSGYRVFPSKQREFVMKMANGVKGGTVAVMFDDYRFSVFDSGAEIECFKRTVEYLITACLSLPA
jgi:hypothetical protein